MSKKATNTNTNTNGNAKAEESVKPTLGFIRPLTAKAVADGWTLCLNERGCISPLGERQISAFLASADKDAKAEKESAKAVDAELRKICAKAYDLPHLLADGWKIGTKLNFRLCRALKLFGPSAHSLVSRIDSVRDKMREYRATVKLATANLLEATKDGKSQKKVLQVYTEAVKAMEAYEPTFKEEEKKYKKVARDAVAVLSNMADLRGC